MSIFNVRATGFAHTEPQDLEQIRRALDIFPDPDHFLFLQALPSGIWQYFQASDIPEILGWIEKHADAKSIFYAINPAKDAHDKAMRVGDAAYRRWILIDVDRNKTLQPNDPSTEQEHEDARELAFEVMSYLSEIGFPAPIEVDSGNGFHLYYRIHLENTTENRDLIHDFLKLLDNSFSCSKGTIGDECFDARRLSRMPGCWSRRGTASKERPYRMCRFMPHTPTPHLVSVELLKKLVSDGIKEKITAIVEPSVIVPPTPISAPTSMLNLTATSNEDKRREAYVNKAIKDECDKLGSMKPGDRNDQLFKTSAALYELVAGGLVDESVVEVAIWNAAYRCDMQNDKDAGGDKGIRGTIESGKSNGMQNPRKMPESEQKPPPAPQPIESGKRIIVLASEIEPRSVEWLWPGRIPLGKLTTFAGNGGLGKTMVLTDIAAKITNGTTWPDGSSGNTSGKVLYVSGEDDPEDTLVPRLIAAGGKRENVAYFIPEILGKFTLADLPALDMALDQLGEKCLLVAIDPPTAYLGGANDHKNSELRQLLSPLAAWAAKRKVAVVFITHVTKPQAAKVEAIMRVLGSVAWVNAVRAAHMFATDPEDDNRCLFVPMKSNLGKRRKGIAYQVQEIDSSIVDGPARVAWLGEIDTTANEAVSGFRNAKKRDVIASEWLAERFQERLEWPSKELAADAKNEGISWNALVEAKDLLGCPKPRKITAMNGSTHWVWWVPIDWKPKSPDQQNESKSSNSSNENGKPLDELEDLSQDVF